MSKKRNDQASLRRRRETALFHLRRNLGKYFDKVSSGDDRYAQKLERTKREIAILDARV